MLEVQTALCSLSLLGTRRRVMLTNKIFCVVLYGCNLWKSKVHKTEMPQTGLLGVQAEFPFNPFLKHREHYFAKECSIEAR